jgi:tRNA-splicing ligase RtcB (3'-phosphate/5'-hydroxy nucleic acid ligase)
VRLVRTDLELKDVRGRIDDLLSECFRSVPAGLGGGGGIGLTERTLEQVCLKGSAWAVRHGNGTQADLAATEGGGCLDWADPAAVSDRAKKRGIDQLGTLGSGNHFLEIQVVDEILEPEAARAFGIEATGQITVMIHCGSRGFGHQVCDDSIAIMQQASRKYDIRLPDRQLGCAPVRSPEGERYLAAMACAANYAWANRQIIMQRVREAFERVLGAPSERLGMHLVYDVAHNIAKIERHEVNGKTEELCVHRKGATRAFAPGHAEVPEAYRAFGQPVIVPGDMGRASWLLAGTEKAMAETFGSTCHGAGRRLSRSAAKALRSSREVIDELAAKGIRVMTHSAAGAAEEQPAAYKDVSEVVHAAAGAGLSLPVARLRPLAVIKG